MSSQVLEKSGSYGEFRQRWPILVASTVGLGANVVSLVFYGFGAFILPLQEEFGWSRGSISSLFFVTTLTLSVCGPVVGVLLDRFGSRRIAVTGIPLLSVSFLGLSRFEGSFAAFTGAFIVVAILAGGTGALVYTRAVNGAFERARGFALGIAIGGMGVAAIALPIALSGIISTYSWRGGFVTLAAIALLPWPLAFFALPRHRRTESMGPAENAAAVGEPLLGTADATPRQAVRSGVFWHLVLCFVLVGISAAAVVPHLIPLLSAAGVDLAHASKVASAVGVGVLVGRVTVGWFLDRFFAPFVIGPLFLVTALAYLMFVGGSVRFAVLGALLIGLSVGAEADVVAYLCARYFGLRHYGVIYGMVYGVFAASIGVGPLLLGMAYDRFGDYRVGLILCSAILIVGALLSVRLPRFDRVRWTSTEPLPSGPVGSGTAGDSAGLTAGGHEALVDGSPRA